MRTSILGDTISYEIVVSHEAPSPGRTSPPLRNGNVPINFVLHDLVATLSRPLSSPRVVRRGLMEISLRRLLHLDELPLTSPTVERFKATMDLLGVPAHVHSTLMMELKLEALDMEVERLLRSSSSSGSRQGVVFCVDIAAYPSDLDPLDEENRENEENLSAVSEESINRLERFVVDKTKAGDRCTMCLDDMEYGNQVARTPCGHIYHEDCIVKWLGVSPTCPNCRCRLA